jgi:hypothetical protein
MLTKRITRPHPLALRLSDEESLHLGVLADFLNRSKTDVIKLLLADEFEEQCKTQKTALNKLIKKYQALQIQRATGKKGNRK